MTKNFDYKKVEICHRCGGTGTLMTEDGEITCDICAGTGRVIKHTTGKVTITPYEGGIDDNSDRL